MTSVVLDANEENMFATTKKSKVVNKPFQHICHETIQLKYPIDNQSQFSSQESSDVHSKDDCVQSDLDRFTQYDLYDSYNDQCQHETPMTMENISKINKVSCSQKNMRVMQWIGFVRNNKETLHYPYPYMYK